MPNANIPKNTAAVLELLKQCARDMRTITYGEVAERCGGTPVGAGYPIGYIRDEICRKHGRPWLSVLAVNGTSMRPGGNYLPEDMTIPEELDELWWRGMVSQVYAYNWSDVEIGD